MQRPSGYRVAYTVLTLKPGCVLRPIRDNRRAPNSLPRMRGGGQRQAGNWRSGWLQLQPVKAAAEAFDGALAAAASERADALFVVVDSMFFMHQHG